MEQMLEWLRANPDVTGFGVATLIFFVTVLLVSRKWIDFWVTIVLLAFALISGLVIANQGMLKSWKQNGQEKELPAE